MPISHISVLTRWLAAALTVCTLAACKTDDNAAIAGSATATSDGSVSSSGVAGLGPTTEVDAVRLANQASFGATEALVAQIAQSGPRSWLLAQFDAPKSVYYSAIDEFDDAAHGYADKCLPPYTSTNDERVWCTYMAQYVLPVQHDFFTQGVTGEDQLRQRVAYALSQIFVVGEIRNAMGTQTLQQMLRDEAFGNYRDILHKVTLNPAMGTWLNLADSWKDWPNENYAREVMELFTVGKCMLNADGSIKNATCEAPYDNDTVQQYARALSGWGIKSFHEDMISYQDRHDLSARPLLSGITVPANSTPPQALELVIDSLMAHPNLGPFVARNMIRFLVTGNPTAGYVSRVSSAFLSGSFQGIGSGVKGDMKATVAAILLDNEARSLSIANQASYGRLREAPIVAIAAMRALNGSLDGIGWGANLQFTGYGPFVSGTVFNFYPAVFPLPGSSDVNAPEFGAATPTTNISRTNGLGWLIYQNGYFSGFGGKIDYTPYIADAVADPRKLVDRMDRFLTAGRLSESTKAGIAEAMNEWSAADVDGGPSFQYDNYGGNWQRERVRMAAFLIMSSPTFQIQR